MGVLSVTVVDRNEPVSRRTDLQLPVDVYYQVFTAPCVLQSLTAGAERAKSVGLDRQMEFIELVTRFANTVDHRHKGFPQASHGFARRRLIRI